VGILCAGHTTPSICKRWHLTSPTSGGGSVGIVGQRTKATGFGLVSFLVSHFLPFQLCWVSEDVQILVMLSLWKRDFS
jgi:hypothetical protein